MSDQSARLSLPYIMPAQAQKHVTHNEAVEQLDILVQLTVEAVDGVTPPPAPLEGEAHALGSGASGDWTDHDGDIAVFSNGAWRFVAPQVGWRLFARDVDDLRVWNGTEWGALPQNTDDLNGVGIRTTHDATNRLSVVSKATLLSHDGNGHQLKINKATPTDTGSVLFQSNWSGRAEMGLAGEDDFSFKTSADGANWNTGLRLSATDATLTMPNPIAPAGIHLGGAAPENHLSIYETRSYTPNLIDQSGNSVPLSPVAVEWIRVGSMATFYYGPILDIDTTGLVPSDILALDLPVMPGAFSFGFLELAGPVARPGPFQWTVKPGLAQARTRCTGSAMELTISDFTSGATSIVGGTLSVYVA
ncbi:MAG: DUF2793 domain-containing protein [Pseudomonadota bacterium]